MLASPPILRLSRRILNLHIVKLTRRMSRSAIQGVTNYSSWGWQLGPSRWQTCKRLDTLEEMILNVNGSKIHSGFANNSWTTHVNPSFLQSLSVNVTYHRLYFVLEGGNDTFMSYCLYNLLKSHTFHTCINSQCTDHTRLTWSQEYFACLLP